MTRSMLSRTLLAVLLIGALVACGDDDADESADIDPSSTTAAADDEAVGLDPASCAGIAELNESVVALPEGPEALAYVNDVMIPIVEELGSSPDAEVAADAATIQGGLEEAIETQREPGSPEVVAAFNGLGAAAHGGCGLATADVTAVDYAFEGLPETLPAGVVSFALTNRGAEEHELLVFRRNDGVTESAEEIVALPQGDAEQLATFAAVTFAAPGETTYAQSELTAGDYFVACFVPVGGDEAGGPPHAEQGMVAEFTVS